MHDVPKPQQSLYPIDKMESDPATYLWRAKDEISIPVYKWKFIHTHGGESIPCHHKGGCMSIIPKGRNVPKSGFPVNDTWLIYGQPKIGKTTLAAQFPEPLIIDLEGGSSFTDATVVVAKSLDDVNDVINELLDGRIIDFKTIIIDSIDVVYDLIERETCAYLSKKLKMNIENIGEAPMGSDWAEARKRFIGFIEAWKSLGVNVVFIAHAKSVMGEKGTIVEKAKTIDLPGKLAHRFPSKVDNIAFCYAAKETVDGKRVVQRRMSFQPYEELEAGSRNPELNGKDLELSFKEILGCFENGAKQASNPPAKKVLRKVVARQSKRR